jgi:hypothetical protein
MLNAVFLKIGQHLDGTTRFAGAAALHRTLANGFDQGKSVFPDP